MKKILIIFCVFIFTLALTASVSAAPNPDDLVGWWNMDGDALDSSYSGFDGTAFGDTVFVDEDGHYAASFDGDGDYISVENVSDLNFTNAVTVEGWVKLNAIGSGNQATIAGKWDDINGNYREYLLTVNASGQASFYLSSDGIIYPKAMWATPLTVGTWYHLAGTYNGSDIKLFVDGVEKASTPFSSILYLNTEQLLIGANDGYGGVTRKFTDGFVDDVRIWKTALSEADLMMSAEDLYELLDTDDDGDGVGNFSDLCDGTVADNPTEGLGVNRHVWYVGEDFTTLIPDGKTKNEETSQFSLEDTYGCSCEQILGIMEEKTGFDFEGHYKHGCSKSIIEDWMADRYYVGPTFVETVEVPGTSGTPVESSDILGAGNNYFLTASGTYRFANWGEYGIADAEWAYRDAAHAPDGIAGWVKGEGYYASECGLDVQVDGSCVNWGDAYSNLGYTIDYVGTGDKVQFHIYDNVYTDNSGSIFVDIYEDKWIGLW